MDDAWAAFKPETVTQGDPWESFKPEKAAAAPPASNGESPDLGMVNGMDQPFPQAFIDRLDQGTSVSRILNRAIEGFKGGLGAEPVTGISDETRQQMTDLGIMHDPAKGYSAAAPMHLFNETAIIPVAKAFETLMRGANAGLHGAAGAFGQIVDEMGGQGDKAEREAINAGNWALIESGMGRFARPGPGPDNVVGSLPREADFQNAAKVIGSDNAAPKLKELWQEHGIHPSEVAHDAQSDAFLRHDLTTKGVETETPKEFADTAPGGAPQSLGAAVNDLPPDVPPSVQPTQPPGKLAASIQGGIDKLMDIGRDAQMLVAPMARGTTDTIAMAKDFANTMRRNRWEWSRLDDDIAKRFTPEQRTRMWNAADEESVVRQETSFPKIPEGLSLRVDDGAAVGGNREYRLVDADGKTHYRAEIATAADGDGLPANAAGISWIENESRAHSGIGPAFYQKIADHLNGEGRRLFVGGSATEKASRVHATLEKSGYAKEIDPDAIRPGMGAEARAAGADARFLEVSGKPEFEHMGLATLEPAERAAVEDLQSRAQAAWVRARDLGMVEGEGLPAYTPRMVINAAHAVEGEGAIPLNGIGMNLKTRTGNMKRRANMTAEETEAAMKESMGPDAAIARDIRALPLATAKLEDAIAGRSLIENIKDYGKRTGTESVAEGSIPSGTDAKWFTLDHPAFKTWRPKLDEAGVVKDAEGNIMFEQVPLYVHGDFEGPLRAVLTSRSGPLYQGMMELKGKSMSLIMNSPMIHNAVEFGRAFPAMPTRIFKAYFDGNRAKNDMAIMGEAIDNGLVPIGKRFFNQDITSVMEAPDLTPGRSWTAKVLAAVPGLFDEAAGTAVKRAIDKAGDFWHNTLLWDRIADLQMGIYTNLRGDMMGKGVDQQTASRVAAHFANRYAGALPKEAMSDAATKVANMMLFSRTFTLGNLGVMKDMMTGLPKDVMAQIERDMGTINPEAAGYAKSLARRKAMATVALDIGLLYAGNSVMQSALNVMLGDSTLDQESHGYAKRLKETLNQVETHPLSLLQPFDLAQRLSATSENEPGKQDRLRIGYAKDGTAIYARNPVGKIGEEFVGYLSGPLDMLRKKQGTIARPMLQVINNDKGFGRKIYDENASTPAAYANNIWEIVKHFGKSQIPEGQIGALSDLVKGEGDPKVNSLGAFGLMAGVTFSKGAPGGPAVGEMYKAKEMQKFQVDQALPDIRKQIQRGDLSGAQEAMTNLSIPPGLQRFYIRTSQNPATRLSPKGLRDFYMSATPEQRQRMENLRTPSPLSPQ